MHGLVGRRARLVAETARVMLVGAGRVTRRRLPPLSLATAAAVMLAAAVASAVVLVTSTSASALARDGAIAVFVAVAVWMFASERYVVTLAVYLLYLGLLDGFLKLRTGSSFVTLGRDVLLYSLAAGAITRAVLRRRPLPAAPPLLLGVLAWVALCLAQIFNPEAVSIAHATASIRQHIEFVPLFFFGFFVLRSERRLAGLFALLAVVASINGVVALLQEHLSPAELASWGAGYAREVYGTATLSGRTFYVNGTEYIRPPALGGDFGFGGLMGVIALPGTIALLGYARRSRRIAAIAWLCGPFVILAVVTSQARLQVVCAVVAGIVFLALTVTSRRGATVLLATVVLGALAYTVSSTLLKGSGPNRYGSIAPSKVISTSVNYREATLALIPTYAVDYPLGAGMGSAGPAANVGLGGSGAKPLDAESEFNFLEIELGVPGLLIMIVFVLAAIGLGLRLRRLRDPDLQRLLAAFTAVLIAFVVSWLDAPDTAASPSSPFLWLAAGTLAYWYSMMRSGALPVRGRRLLRA